MTWLSKAASSLRAEARRHVRRLLSRYEEVGNGQKDVSLVLDQVLPLVESTHRVGRGDLVLDRVRVEWGVLRGNEGFGVGVVEKSTNLPSPTIRVYGRRGVGSFEETCAGGYVQHGVREGGTVARGTQRRQVVSPYGPGNSAKHRPRRPDSVAHS